jgi:hypothetical protein
VHARRHERDLRCLLTVALPAAHELPGDVVHLETVPAVKTTVGVRRTNALTDSDQAPARDVTLGLRLSDHGASPAMR